MPRILSFPAVLGSILLFTACMNDADEDAPREDSLIVNSWTLSQATVSPELPDDFGTDLLQFFTDCDLSAPLEFRADGRFFQIPDPGECENEEEVTEATDSGSYVLNGSMIVLTSEVEDEPTELTIITLDSGTLEVTQEFPAGEFDDDIDRTATFTFMTP